MPQDYNKAVLWFSKAAEQGCAAAQNNLGVSYSNGFGVPQDYNKAVLWYTKAAEQGYANAQITLAEIYYWGKNGQPIDYTAAVNWYRKCAENGNCYAMGMLAQCYMEGKGERKDLKLARYWAEKGVEQGDQQSYYILNELDGKPNDGAATVNMGIGL